jgi:glycolate oxidase
VARGAGTGLSGGALALDRGVIIELARMNRILSIDAGNRCAVVQPGVVNIALSKAAAPHGLHFAPDPSSQGACTVGGNAAENSGGPHCLKYGATVQHVLGMEIVLPDGTIERIGGAAPEEPGGDLIGAIVGCEGTFGVITELTLRLTPIPESVRTMLAVFETIDDATECVSAIIGAGILPAALEMIDNTVIEALEAAFHYGFPLDAGALLIIEIDGPAPSLDRQAAQIESIAKQCRAREVRTAADAADRAALWRARKRAFGALGRVAPSYYTQDGVIPRSRLPEVLRSVRAIAAKHQLRIANIFHAGDGNLHPCLLFDDQNADERRRVLLAGDEILAACVAAGGSITGEHGIGIEKLRAAHLQFSDDDMRWMNFLRAAFDPAGICNPGKIFPSGGHCVEVGVGHRRVAL